MAIHTIFMDDFLRLGLGQVRGGKYQCTTIMSYDVTNCTSRLE